MSLITTTVTGWNQTWAVSVPNTKASLQDTTTCVLLKVLLSSPQTVLLSEPSNLSMLCQICYTGWVEAINDPTHDSPETWAKSLRDIRDSANADCLFCLSFWEHIPPLLSDVVNDSISTESMERLGRHVHFDILRVHQQTDRTPSQGFYHHIGVHIPDEWLDPSLSFAGELYREGSYEVQHATRFHLPSQVWSLTKGLHTDCQMKLSSVARNEGLYRALLWQISAWLHEDLVRSHRSTVLPLGSSMAHVFYPSRLIDLAHVGQGIFVLEETKNWTSGRAYAALSYTWAQTENLRCLSSNIDRLRQGQHLSILNDNIAQAMKIVAGLNIQYVWIDALCIVQDDSKDLQSVLSQMDKVYTEAVLTVAINVDPSRLSPLVDVLLESLERSQWLHQLETSTVLIPRPDPYQEIALASLSRRGWCLQERLLAARVVHILPSGVFWEGTPGQEDYIRTFADPEQEIKPDLCNIRFRHPQASRASIARIGERPHAGDERRASFDSVFLDCWSRILADYSIRHLSYKRDSLVAIAAIAERLSRSTGLTFIWGLWLELLPFCLVWYNYTSGMDDPVAFCRVDVETGSRFPSWSWGGWRGRKQPSTWIGEQLALLYGELNHDAADGSSLTIHGKLVGPFDLVWLTGSESTQIPYAHAFNGVAGVEHFSLEIIQELGCNQTINTDQSTCFFFLDDTTNRELADELWFCPAVLVSQQKELRLAGPLMKRQRDNVFERIGLLSVILGFWPRDRSRGEFFDNNSLPRLSPTPHIPEGATIFTLV